ncbi:putative ribosome biogenesis protein slx9-like [Benincasa hispida]|uniref:putative ribosome biogenesis protein slx9-like n=1 Tax=Benincasa hispida TaxID=102211 RepID=UPI0019022BFC|nr:putative ribosome biogenesis protein slx9-like [Benincasa hispida]XP_038900087.1 putative ribosome biogenesis protein slx9-like [Benincasa hispida]XP_038900088.1 putative ribosome biogenesis protein slx9-like [Benincasa hispida]XP_038900089.1 putative ribosome biogenesis protein slx9-like [Benincasa hispida]XP_038900091.1 putative ribosome biogenesis protein slx9-like [Benincasa hispida]
MGKPVSRSDSKSKAERKFEKKVQFYERVGETISTLNAQKTITKKKSHRRRKRDLKAFDLSTLSEFLPGLEAPKQKPSAAELKLNCKSRLKFILKERKQMGTVLNHPVFQADPLRAIQLHLEGTQPIEEPKKKTNKNGSKKRKEKKSKASPRPSSMEM